MENQTVPVDIRVWSEACTLRDAGYQVTVICPKGTQAHYEARECRDGIQIYRFSVPAGDSALHFIAEWGVAMLQTLRLSLVAWFRDGFDVIHVANPPDMFFPLAWLYRPFGARFVFDQHDLTLEVFAARFERRMLGRTGAVLLRLLALAERLSYRAADLVIVTNETFRRIAVERGGVRPDRVVVVRNGPDLKRLYPRAPAPGLRPSHGCLLGFVGAMGHQDGADYALRALDVLVHHRGRDDVCLMLVGDGSAVPSLRELARHLGLDGHVRFVGWVAPDQVPDYLSALDIGLSPEPYNALNASSTLIKVMEYMAMAKPVVAFDLPETRVSLGDAGLYAPPNSIEGFAARIEELLDRPDLRCRLGEEGRRRVERELSWDRSRQALLSGYGALREQAPGPKAVG